MINDKRKDLRRPMQYTAWVALADSKTPQGCVLSDISESGARLDIENAESVPDDFVLLLSRRGVPKRKCRVIWRTEHQLGVTFDRTLPARDKPKPVKRQEPTSVN
jgi:hypothetical protein